MQSLERIRKACTNSADLKQGLLVHAQIIETGFSLSMIVANAILDMYIKCACFRDAHSVFDQLPSRDVVTWSSLIAGYSQHGHHHVAICLFHQMSEEGIQPNVFTWNALIAGCSDQGQNFQIFEQMQATINPDNVTLVSMLKACSTVCQIWQIQNYAAEVGYDEDLLVGNALIDMHSKYGSLSDACRVFDCLKSRNTVTWNSIIIGHLENNEIGCALRYFESMQNEGIALDNMAWNALIGAHASHGCAHEAFNLFEKMEMLGMDPDKITYINILKACERPDMLKLVHSRALEHNVHLDLMVANTLIDLYSKTGNLEDAQQVFGILPDCNIGTWNTMIAGYTQAGAGQYALILFDKLLDLSVEPDNITFVSIFRACSVIVGVDQGRLIHGFLFECSFHMDNFVWGAMLDMYAKWGNLDDAQSVFSQIPNRDVVIWNAIIAGYAHVNNYELVLQLFTKMLEESVKPNDVTYLSLLLACSHSGLVEEGRMHVQHLCENYEIVPTVLHYDCVADLLGRVGQLEEAQGLLESAPFENNIVGWMSLLGHCRLHGSPELGKKCFDHLVTINCSYGAPYVMTSDIYANVGMLTDANDLLELKLHVDAWKRPGNAILELDGKVEEFIVGYLGCAKTKFLHFKLEGMQLKLRDAGHVPSV